MEILDAITKPSILSLPGTGFSLRKMPLLVVFFKEVFAVLMQNSLQPAAQWQRLGRRPLTSAEPSAPSLQHVLEVVTLARIAQFPLEFSFNTLFGTRH